MLRVLNICHAKLPPKASEELLKLRNLEIIINFGNPMGTSISKQLAFYKKFPNLTAYNFSNSDLDLSDAQYDAISDFLISRKSKVKHFLTKNTPDEYLLHTLGHCPNLITYRYDHCHVNQPDDFAPLLSSETSQQTLQDIRLDDPTLTSNDFALLAKFTNIRCLNIERTKITEEELSKILINNSRTIREVNVKRCTHIGTEIIPAISQCLYLHRFEIHGRQPLAIALAHYVCTQRRNWHAIQFQTLTQEIELQRAEDGTMYSHLLFSRH